MRAQASGFTLTELLVAVALFGIAATAVHGIQATAIRGQSAMMRKMVVENNATLVGSAMRDALASANVIVRPGVGETAAELLVLENVDPRDNVSPLPGVPLAPRFSYFCADSGGSMHLYRGELPAPNINCGHAPPQKAEKLLVVGQANSLQVAPLFSRPARNSVYVEYEVRYNNRAGDQPITVKHATQINIQNAAQ